VPYGPTPAVTGIAVPVYSHRLEVAGLTDAAFRLCVQVISAARPVSYIIVYILSGVRLSPLGTAATIGLLYQP
jgi:hypothetical protein